MRIEPIQSQDIPELVEICRIGHIESRYRKFTFSPEKVAHTFFKAASNPDMLAVKCSASRICGFFVGTVSEMEFALEPIGVEVSFLVAPEHRGTRCAYLLVQAFLDWCERRGIPAFTCIHYAEDNERTYRFLERMGMTEIGKVFGKDL